ncbi:MAG: hypothetical protein AB7I30_12660 [Isosphaeraceae bacterium]
MASDPKPTTPAPATLSKTKKPREGVRLFTYPKVIFMFPTLVAAIICWLGMLMTGNQTAPPNLDGYEQFKTPSNLFGVLFLGVFAFNLMVMALDFPRFTIIAGVLFALLGIFFFLWVGTYFEVDLFQWSRGILSHVHVEAKAGFYSMVMLIMLLMYAIIYVTRYLDYWEIRPNEILRHHGPLSDLERYPTLNLKFDKEIPDVLEYMFLGSGRIVLNIPGQNRSIVLDNVLFINAVERALKGLMSRMEVRLTTDQELVEN